MIDNELNVISLFFTCKYAKLKLKNDFNYGKLLFLWD